MTELARRFSDEITRICTTFDKGLSNTSTKKFNQLVPIVSEMLHIGEEEIYVTAAASRASNLWNRLAQGKPLTQHFSFALGIIDADNLQGGISPARRFIGDGVGHYDAIALAIQNAGNWVIGAVLDTEKLSIFEAVKDIFPGIEIEHSFIASVEDDSADVVVDESKRVTGGTNIILYGVPGSGKSWTISQEYCKDESRMERLVFHPDYLYTDFIGQILPVVRGDKVRYEFAPGPFTRIMKKAYHDYENMYYLIIEEINRGNAPAVFGEIFQLLDRVTEEGGWPVGTSEYGITHADMAKEIYGYERKIRIPSNLCILGTMNTSDQNVFTLDTAFQRRWVMRMIPNSFENHRFANRPILDSAVSWKAFCFAVNDEVLRRNHVTSSEDKRLGAYFITAADLVWHSEEDSIADHTSRTWIDARHSNARFAEKVLKYLWDDAFKFSHPEVFNTGTYKSLELVIGRFCNARRDDRFDVFNENLRKLIEEQARIYPAASADALTSQTGTEDQEAGESQ